jgi:hypothetical protein
MAHFLEEFGVERLRSGQRLASVLELSDVRE